MGLSGLVQTILSVRRYSLLKEKAKPEPTGEMCPECGHELVKRKSRYGTTFIGCSNYPKCRYIKKEPKEKK